MAGLEKKICDICGKEFFPFNPQSKVCSDECRKERKKLYHAELNRQRRRETRERLGTRICVVCGAEFAPRNGNAVTCNPICTRERQRLLDIERGREKRANKRKEKAAKKKKKDTLCKINGKARAMGLSYGKYQLMLQLEAQKKERGVKIGN